MEETDFFDVIRFITNEPLEE